MIEAILAGLIGLLIGSFLNVCIYRWPRDLSVIHPGSHCPNCEKPIAWYDLIPVFSWIALRGRCRHCGNGISYRYPLVELLIGAMFFLAVYTMGPTAQAMKFAIFAAMQVTLLFTDLEERILPDEFTLGGIVVGLAFAVAVPMPFGIVQMVSGHNLSPMVVSVLDSAFGAFMPMWILWSIGAIYKRVRGREGLGLGDIKMVAMMGAFLGLSGVLGSIMIGSIIGTVVGVLYIWLARKDAKTFELPFGSFLALAALIVAFQAGPLEALRR